MFHQQADEKFTALNGQCMYVTTTVGDDVILGVATRPTVQTEELMQAYGEFRTEA